MANWGTAIPIIVAIIGISGLIVPPLSAIYNKPNLNIDIGSKKAEPNQTLINLTNSGAVPASNLSFILTTNEASKIINTVTNEFSTVDLTLALPGSPTHSLLEINRAMIINRPFLELHVKKLINGDGSIIKLAINGKNTQFTDYTAYAIYDEGSKKTTSILIPKNLKWLEVFPFNLLTGVSPAAGLFFTLAEAIVILYLPIWFRMRRKRRSHANITQDIMEVRKKLKANLSYADILLGREKEWGRERKMLLPSITGGSKLRDRDIITSINDYIVVDDFYSQVIERDSYIDSKFGNNQAIDDIALVTQNKTCLDLAEAALEKIDWSKYK
jgi:hypothetical protein